MVWCPKGDPNNEPLGVEQLKIVIAYFRGELPQTVTQRMSPLGVAHWKIEIPYFRGALPQTVTQQMSPLGVAHWKIELPYFRGALPQMVTQRMSPLGVAQWKIEIPYFRGAVPQTVTQRMSPLGEAHWKSKQVSKIKCPPPQPEAKKNSFAPQMIFLGLRPGGWAFNFWHLFRFSMCYPKGAHSLGHRLGHHATK